MAYTVDMVYTIDMVYTVDMIHAVAMVFTVEMREMRGVRGMRAELQKPRQRVSNADRKVFANPESFCDKFIIG